MYRLQSYNKKIDAIFFIRVNTFIPFDPLNTDYQQFKTDISNGAELQDPDGKVMTPKQVSDFIKTLP